jgi:hypothetical protein
MIFQYTLDLLLSGRKTQTCRIAKTGEIGERGTHNAIVAVTFKGHDKYRVGKTYAVQPARGKPAVARIGLVGIDHKKISEITREEAEAEGYSSREEFFGVWQSIHGDKNADAEVWVLKFELIHLS